MEPKESIKNPNMIPQEPPSGYNQSIPVKRETTDSIQPNQREIEEQRALNKLRQDTETQMRQERADREISAKEQYDQWIGAILDISGRDFVDIREQCEEPCASSQRLWNEIEKQLVEHFEKKWQENREDYINHIFTQRREDLNPVKNEIQEMIKFTAEQNKSNNLLSTGLRTLHKIRFKEMRDLYREAEQHKRRLCELEVILLEKQKKIERYEERFEAQSPTSPLSPTSPSKLLHMFKTGGNFVPELEIPALIQVCARKVSKDELFEVFNGMVTYLQQVIEGQHKLRNAFIKNERVHTRIARLLFAIQALQNPSEAISWPYWQSQKVSEEDMINTCHELCTDALGKILGNLKASIQSSPPDWFEKMKEWGLISIFSQLILPEKPQKNFDYLGVRESILETTGLPSILGALLVSSANWIEQLNSLDWKSLQKGDQRTILEKLWEMKEAKKAHSRNLKKAISRHPSQESFRHGRSLSLNFSEKSLNFKGSL